MGQGAYIFAPAGPDLTPEEAAFFRDADPWGFIVFQRNCETPDQLRRLTSRLRGAVGRNAPVLIDQEGGRVQRMRAPHWKEWMPPLDQAALFSDQGDTEKMRRAMYLRGRLIGAELMAAGESNYRPFLRVRARLEGSTDGLSTPVFSGWSTEFHCIPFE